MRISSLRNKKSRTQDFILYLTIAIFTMGVALCALGFNSNFDTMQNLTSGDWVFGPFLIKSIQENGIFGIFYNSRVGVPTGSILVDYPVVDWIMAIIVWILSWFIKSTARLIYSYYILTFALDGVSMAILLRKLKIKRAIVFVASGVFAFAPYHFVRGMFHITLINYMYFPIAVYLSLYILGFFEEEKKWKISLAAIGLGFGYGYYYAFGLIIMVIALVMRALQGKNLKKTIASVWSVGLVFIAIFCALLPKIIFALIYGKNNLVGIRLPIEQEIYGLRIIQLFLPPIYAKVPALKNIAFKYAEVASGYNMSTSLGFIISIGFLLLCFALIYSLIAKDKCMDKEWKMIDFFSLSTLVLVLMGTVGGFGEILNWVITAQIRDYSRICIFIAGFSVMTIAYGVNKIVIRNNIVLWLVCVMIMGGSIYDTVLVNDKDWQVNDISQQKCYKEFFEEVENRLDDGAMVYQLPYVDFPESTSKIDYKHFIGYLYTDMIRWSYGEMKGRTNVAKDFLENEGKSYLFLKKIKEAGFEAVYIDINGYPDDGEDVLAFYNSLEIEPLISSDGTLYLFDIRNYDVPIYKTCAGYSFVESWNSYFELGLSEDEIIELANRIGDMDEQTYMLLIENLVDSRIYQGISNTEYMEFLYKIVLCRVGSIVNEQDGWVIELDKGMRREDILYILLHSPEFRMKQGYDISK